MKESRVFPLEEEPAALVRNVLAPVRPEPARLETIFQRVLASRPRRRGRLRSRAAAVGAVLLVSSASVAAYRLLDARRPSPAAPAPVKAASLPAAAPAPRIEVAGERPAPPAPLAPPPRARAKTPSHRQPAVSQLETEASLLAAPLARIRRGGDLVAALGEIDEYLRSFPRGALRPEAKLARVDALLLLGRRQAALQALDELDLDDKGRSLELRLTRGELRAQSDCRAALADFEAVLRAAPPADLGARARRDQAACHRRLGRTTP